MADSSDDEIRELIECLYGAMDKQDTSTFDALVSSRVVVEVGSSAPGSTNGGPTCRRSTAAFRMAAT